MNLADAEKEVWLRNYAWAKTEWEKEINKSLTELLESVRRVEVRTNRFLNDMAGERARPGRSQRHPHRWLGDGGNQLKLLGEKTFSNGGSLRKIGGRHREIRGNVPSNGGSTRENGGGLPQIGGSCRENGGSLPEIGGSSGKNGGNRPAMRAGIGKLGDRLQTLGAKPGNDAAGTSCGLFPSNLTGLANAATRLVNRHS